MTTLIFNGSPRKDGDTAALIDAFEAAHNGALHIVDCYRADISPCLDCRFCKDAFVCHIEDDMQSVYDYIHRSDNIIIASPVFYSQLTGPLLSVLSRLQPGFYARRRGKPGFSDRPRRGGILLAGGGDGSPSPALATARTLLRAMGCVEIAEPVTSLNTDALPASRDDRALQASCDLAESWLKIE